MKYSPTISLSDIICKKSYKLSITQRDVICKLFTTSFENEVTSTLEERLVSVANTSKDFMNDEHDAYYLYSGLVKVQDRISFDVTLGNLIPLFKYLCKPDLDPSSYQKCVDVMRLHSEHTIADVRSIVDKIDTKDTYLYELVANLRAVLLTFTKLNAAINKVKLTYKLAYPNEVSMTH